MIGDTSVGAPLWAGVYSPINTTMEGFGFGQAGFANPPLYGVVYNGFIAINNIHDVFEGSNGITSNGQEIGFNAGQFYDNTTRLESFVAGDLLVDFAAGAAFSGTRNFPAIPTNIRVAATPTSATVTWTGAPTATGYFVEVEVEVETVTAPQKLVLETVSKDPTTIIPACRRTRPTR